MADNFNICDQPPAVTTLGGFSGDGSRFLANDGTWKAAAEGSHPDLTTHNELGLSTQGELDGHEASADPHTQYQRESERGVANGYASLDGNGTIPDSQIPATIARDSELPDLAGHVSAADPHAGYVREADANWTDLTDGGETTLHTHAGGSGKPLDAWPVGSVFISVVSTSPATLLGGGTWAAFATGRMLVGIDAGQTEFDTVEETGGAKTVTLDVTQMPAHTHVETSNNATTGPNRGWGAPDTSTNTETATGYNTQSAGGGGAHDNLPPYIVVYMWKRTA